jgi:glycosyltransferase involved in cell wall biosynthesis
LEASLRDESAVDQVKFSEFSEGIPKLKVALIHEWLYTYAGAEKVLEIMLSEFPDADVFSLIDRMPRQHRGGLRGKPIRTTFLQKIPFVQFFYRRLLPLMPFAIEQLDMSEYDIVISNSHAVAKGVITCARQLHICYCYTPMRYAWDLQEQYLKESGLARGVRSMLARYFRHRIRLWDHSSAQHVDHFIACSAYIARRIRKVYRRDATVIYPNVDTNSFVIGGSREAFYFCSSRMVPYKKMHLIVEAFAKMPDRRLIMIGTGPQFKRIKRLATPNVTLLGYQPFPVLLDHLQRARAFIFAAEEDFGIAPLEAQACGTPVLAFGRGGAQETVIDTRTGLHFHEQTAEAIIDVVERFEALDTKMEPETVRRHALRFSTERFRCEFTDYVLARWAQHVAEVAKTTLQTSRVQDRAAVSASPEAVGV